MAASKTGVGNARQSLHLTHDFFAPDGQNRALQRCFGAKYQFLFEMVQKGPDGPKRVPNGQKHLG